MTLKPQIPFCNYENMKIDSRGCKMALFQKKRIMEFQIFINALKVKLKTVEAEG